MPIINKKNVKDFEEYKEFILNSPYSRVTQDTAWANVKNNWNSIYVCTKKKDKINAALSALYIKAQDDKNLIYVNRGPICNFYDIETVKNLLYELLDTDVAKDAFLIRFDPEVLYDENLIRIYKDNNFKVRSRGIDEKSFTQPRYNAIIDISMDEDTLFNSFSAKCRYNIRLSYKKGVKTDFYKNEEAVDIFYKHTEIMAQRQSISYRPKDYFKRLLDNYTDARIFISSFDNIPLSSAILIPYNKKSWYIYGASDNIKRNFMPNYQMQWEMIKYSKSIGALKYDFGGIFKLSDEDGLYRFKRAFLNNTDFSEYIGEFDYVLDNEAYKKFINK